MFTVSANITPVGMVIDVGVPVGQGFLFDTMLSKWDI